ncbi:hypothetical protein DEO72_LG7g1031 [Vigna unguiculata]|uniref:Uncharacterized protein n=1 Tax=Vigna unguiculata TaxID=3917 RepID=A0A4D6MIB9_VIGUN|nr:hypothetical protein DEO72_LG7g1031 [Vigna unguiculata]
MLICLWQMKRPLAPSSSLGPLDTSSSSSPPDPSLSSCPFRSSSLLDPFVLSGQPGTSGSLDLLHTFGSSGLTGPCRSSSLPDLPDLLGLLHPSDPFMSLGQPDPSESLGPLGLSGW